MIERADLLAGLRALDDELARVPASPRLDARVLSRVRERARHLERPRSSLGARGALSLAIACVALLFAGVGGRACTSPHDSIAEQEDGPAIVRDRSRTPDDPDAGPPAPRDRRGRSLPWLLAPPRAVAPRTRTRDVPPAIDRAPVPHGALSPPAALPDDVLVPRDARDPSRPPRSHDVAPAPMRAGIAATQAPHPSSTRSTPGNASPAAHAPTSPAAAPPPELAALPPVAPPAPKPDPTPTCRTQLELQLHALEQCEARGLKLTGLTYADDCGDGEFGSVEFTCSDASATCVAAMLGDGVACHDIGSWKEAALSSCTALGLTLTSFDLAMCTDGGAVYAKYTCCPIQTPAPVGSPPPPNCKAIKLGDGSTCMLIADLKIKAQATCDANASALGSFSILQGSCPADSAALAEIGCCVAQ